MADTSVSLAGVTFKNPVITASGTFASGREYAELTDLSRLGGITTKGVSMEPWPGNPPPRVAETYGGTLNSVGLQNPGVERFLAEDAPFLRGCGARVIVNICGHTVDEYAAVAEALADSGADMLELNISCPNVKRGGIAFGTDPERVREVTEAVRKKARQPLIVKLSPNVTDITEIARAAEDGGADALSLINTLLGMKIDIRRRRPVLANAVGGLSGPAIMPVAVRMVWAVAKAARVPVVGMGGIMTARDAIEFIMAGAAAIAVGTATFRDPNAAVSIAEGIERFMDENGINSLSEIRGIV
ncbi:MAG: dihydroorotate dehydrogenase [Clostridiales bacterium]|nr:dihydroorotate dehydrogenase [Clostridiales bacterium]